MDNRRAHKQQYKTQWPGASYIVPNGYSMALAGPGAVFATIAAVETFVDEHYRCQIQGLDATASRHSEREILECMERCRLDEVAHRDDAAGRGTGAESRLLQVWTRMVGAGSQFAVGLARYL
ncbi:MAG: hypothetical protein B7X58_09835 [Marinobacter sp. 34-60-7]|nr:MAG: hypothetical protein B7X58_09835 [Marinobacter sp. 34-60-7]